LAQVNNSDFLYVGKNHSQTKIKKPRKHQFPWLYIFITRFTLPGWEVGMGFK